MKKIENKNFIVKKSLIPNAGLGLFTKRKFKKGESLGKYDGELLTEEECDRRYSEQDHVLDLSNAKRNLFPKVYLYPPKKMLLRYINHAPVSIDGKKIRGKKSYNVDFNEIDEYPYVEIIAIKDIEVGDEIYLTYGAYFTKQYVSGNEKAKKFYVG
ncbi:MAG: SET domain-containing protein-lysine N-methyltransferase [Leptospiraceae bacterium]|nr:SET domain-containing protein-lysine N-methyltransferase [Leptospiraceae bacterium]